MVFDAPKPYKPSAMDRRAHPLGERVQIRPPWMSTPPPSGGEPAEPVGAATAAIPFAGQRPEKTDGGKFPAAKISDAATEARTAVAAAPLQRPPPQQPPPQQPQKVAMATPPAEDLFALYRLCGGDEVKVIDLLAQLWGTAAVSIAPMVRQWLQNMPKLVPPSRSRTAPPMLEFAPFWADAAAARAGGGRRISPVPPKLAAMVPLGLHKAPPMSAPGGDGKGVAGRDRTARGGGDVGAGIARQLNALNARVNSRVVLNNEGGALQPMPEDAPVDFWTPTAAEGWGSQVPTQPPPAPPPEPNAEALQAFMARNSQKLSFTGRVGKHMRF